MRKDKNKVTLNEIKNVITVVFVVKCFFCCSVIEAWDNNVTHPDLSEIAARQSKLVKQDYLKQIGLARGIEEIINGKEVFVWIRDGAFLEDAGTRWQTVTRKARFYNHFHNPLKPWYQAGLDDFIFKGESALLWAQDKGAQLGYLEKDDLGGDQTWRTVRQFYYDALNEKTNTDRQANFAKTFRGLGYQMHLLQDMAVPAHVRNDAHPEEAIRRFL